MRSPSLRVLLGVAWYFPDSVGGTEKYVRALATELRTAGVEVALAVPDRAMVRVERSQHEGIEVFRFAPGSGTSGAGQEFDIGAAAPPGWLKVLRAFGPTIVDVHSLTSDLGLAHLTSAREAGARTVVTVHLPGLVCARGTLLRFGHEVCDGDLRRQPCTACRLDARGVPPRVGTLLSDLPSGLADWLDRVPMPAVARRTIAADAAHLARLVWLRAVRDCADRVVVVSAFLKQMLVQNGFASDRVIVCRQGVERSGLTHTPATATVVPGVLRVGFVGRFDPLKGLDVLIDAAERLPQNARIEFHIWGAARTPDAEAYRAAVIRNAQMLPQVIFHGEADSLTPYAEMDVLVVPSVAVETGPFVVLEAQAAGLPVVGSDLGGIAERVTSEVDGLLFPAGDANALADVLMRFWHDPRSLARLRPTQAVRSVADVARETLQTYAVLASERAA